MNRIKRLIGKMSFALKDKKPDILFWLSIGGIGIGTYVAAKETIKAQSVFDEGNKKLAQVRENRVAYETTSYAKALTTCYIWTGKELVKTYWKSILILSGSAICLTSSHEELKERGQFLAAACMSTKQLLDNYKARLAEEVGEEKARDICDGAKIEDVNVKVPVDDGTDEPIDVLMKNVKVIDPISSPYTLIFDNKSPKFSNSTLMNSDTLTNIEHYLNDLFITRGYLYLNDVCDALDIEPVAMGQIVGWIYDPKHKLPGNRDNQIKLRFYETYIRDKERPGNAYLAWVLDPNVDGNINALRFPKRTTKRFEATVNPLNMIKEQVVSTDADGRRPEYI